MSNNELVEKWLSVFAENVPEQIIRDHVLKERNLLWHIFTWGNVPCLHRNAARKAFDKLKYEEAIRFCDGYSGKIRNVSTIGKVSAKELDDDPATDIFVVAKDFSWTYVRTHEVEQCGPYLCIKKRDCYEM